MALAIELPNCVDEVNLVSCPFSYILKLSDLFPGSKRMWIDGPNSQPRQTISPHTAGRSTRTGSSAIAAWTADHRAFAARLARFDRACRASGLLYFFQFRIAQTFLSRVNALLSDACPEHLVQHINYVCVQTAERIKHSSMCAVRPWKVFQGIPNVFKFVIGVR
jgi:hypothetical protein